MKSANRMPCISAALLPAVGHENSSVGRYITKRISLAAAHVCLLAVENCGYDEFDTSSYSLTVPHGKSMVVYFARRTLLLFLQVIITFLPSVTPIPLHTPLAVSPSPSNTTSFTSFSLPLNLTGTT